MAFKFSTPSDKTYEYRLGSNYGKMEDNDPDAYNFCLDVYQSETMIRLKRMNQNQKDAYIESVASSKNPVRNMRKQVGKWIAGTGDTTYDNGDGVDRQFESVQEFIDNVPLPIIVDINYELTKTADSGN